jgi:hypothetical protein
MKKIFSLLLLTLFAAGTSLAQMDHKGPPASPKGEAQTAHVKVEYSRPYKKGRVIFGGLVPYGQVWRTGANEATTITFDKDGDFGGKHIKKGTYTLFTIPGEREWTIILNGQLKQWGSFDYDKYKNKDVLHVTAPVINTENAVEEFTISAEPKALIFEWDKTKVRVPMKF